MSCDNSCCKVDVCLNIVDVCIEDDAKAKFKLILSELCEDDDNGNGKGNGNGNGNGNDD